MKTSTVVELPITKRSRTYGYISWGKHTEDAMEQLLGKCATVDVQIGDVAFTGKNVDRNRKQISIGYRFTRALDQRLKFYRLECPKPGKLRVSFH
jgi:hypothetical protein